MVEDLLVKFNETYEQLQLEISNMDIPNFIIICLLFYIPYRISKRAESTFFRLLFFSIGVYMLINMQDIRVLYDHKMLIGSGLIFPQIRFIFYLIGNVIFTIKMMMANTYYFFVTIYYKILRFFNWIGEILYFIKSIFTRNKKQKQDYKEESYNNYKEQRTGSFYEDRRNRSFDRESEDEYYEYQDNTYESNSKDQTYSENYSSSNNYSNSSYEKSNYQESNNTYEKSSYQSNSNNSNESIENNVSDELKQFYSQSAYIVLGVSENDDLKTIKKSYRVLVSLYHPDKNIDNTELYTEITQNINEAYDKLKKIKS